MTCHTTDFLHKRQREKGTHGKMVCILHTEEGSTGKDGVRIYIGLHEGGRTLPTS